jgi:hypothetical protein
MIRTESRDDWETWVADWHGGRPHRFADDAALRRSVQAYRRRMIWLTVAEALFSVGVIALALYLLARRPGTASVLWTVESGLLLSAAWTFALRNRRGTWRPLAESTEAFLELSRLRCVRRLATVHFVIAVLLAQLVALVAWVLWLGRTRPERLTSPDLLPAWSAAALVFVTYSMWATWYRRRTRRELARIDRLREALADVTV